MGKIEELQKEFLIGTVLRNAVKASMRQNSPYVSNLDQGSIKEIRNRWMIKIREIYETHYTGYLPITEFQERFIDDAWKLREELNEEFEGKAIFKLSHTQKNLSIFLKYIWCMNIGPEPKICPIDRVILEELGINDNWTELDNKEKYKIYIKAINESSSNNPAQWELDVWNRRGLNIKNNVLGNHRKAKQGHSDSVETWMTFKDNVSGGKMRSEEMKILGGGKRKNATIAYLFQKENNEFYLYARDNIYSLLWENGMAESYCDLFDIIRKEFFDKVNITKTEKTGDYLVKHAKDNMDAKEIVENIFQWIVDNYKND